ncbi:MAG: hypothetical protein KGL95_07320, partial [Patescibacteria group bacterium]|nr:hypothetical protein [Patescibacteria group bacterium]
DDFSQIAEEAYQELRQNLAYFDPQLYSEKLSQKLGISVDGKKVEQIVLNEELMEESLYEDTVEVLDFLAKQPNLTLGIFSAGLLQAQLSKVKKLENFFHKDHIHIFEFKKHHALVELLQKYPEESVVMVDDMMHILYEAKLIRPTMHTVWIRRPERSFQDSHIDNFQPDSIIRSLRELIPIIVQEKSI